MSSGVITWPSPRLNSRSVPGAERVEVGREPPDHVEHDLLDPRRVLGEDLE